MACILSKLGIINLSLYNADTEKIILNTKAGYEIQLINKVGEISNGNFAIVQ